MTKRLVILSAKHERIRNTLRGGKRIAAHLAALAMTRDGKADCRSRLYIPPAGSVGASASQRSPPDTRTFAMTKWLVILSAKSERIRNTLRGKTDCRAPCGARNDERWKGGLPQPFIHPACRLGRCFCFAEVSTGHPHLRNDKMACHSECEE